MLSANADAQNSIILGRLACVHEIWTSPVICPNLVLLQLLASSVICPDVASLRSTWCDIVIKTAEMVFRSSTRLAATGR